MKNNKNLSNELEKIFAKILYNFSPKYIDELKNTPNEDLYIYHFSLGLWLRNNILTEDAQIYKLLVNKSIHHKDDMSAYVMQNFHSFLYNVTYQSPKSENI